MVYPFPGHGLRHTTRLRSPVGVLSLWSEEDQASLEAASPESYGRRYRPFRAGSQTPQNRLLACATDSASLILFHAGIERRKNLANDSLLPVMLLTPGSRKAKKLESRLAGEVTTRPSLAPRLDFNCARPHIHRQCVRKRWRGTDAWIGRPGSSQTPHFLRNCG